jgi:tetratricopeptide (TPR) repeat protein
VIELYHHSVRAGHFDEAYDLFRTRIDRETYYGFGAYHLQINLLLALFPDGENAPPRLRDEDAQARLLCDLALVLSMTGQAARTRPLWERALTIFRRLENSLAVAIGLASIADDELNAGSLRAAERNLRTRVDICHELKDEYREAVGRQELGRVLAYRGAWAESESELSSALTNAEAEGRLGDQSILWSYRALGVLLRRRTGTGEDAQAAIDCAQRALDLERENARTKNRPTVISEIRAHWLLGAARCAAGHYGEAETLLHDALQGCRRIGYAVLEADVLATLARLHAAQAADEDARRAALEALTITDRCGYALQGADTHLALAELARARGDLPTAREHAAEALRLATCDGPPDYTYKAAYHEATVLLASLA